MKLQSLYHRLLVKAEYKALLNLDRMFIDIDIKNRVNKLYRKFPYYIYHRESACESLQLLLYFKFTFSHVHPYQEEDKNTSRSRLWRQ